MIACNGKHENLRCRLLTHPLLEVAIETLSDLRQIILKKERAALSHAKMTFQSFFMLAFLFDAFCFCVKNNVKSDTYPRLLQ
jgi:hypothetical protein